MSAIAEIFRPGTAAANAARPIGRQEAKHPYQWLYPGPDSREAMPSGVVAVPAIVSPATSASVRVMQYTVPTGFVYVLRRLLMSTNAQAYSPGQQMLLFTLQALYANGPRQVEWLNNLDFPFGEYTTLPGNFRTLLQEIDRPLVFAPLTTLEISVVNNGIQIPAATDTLIGILGGYLHPESDCR